MQQLPPSSPDQAFQDHIADGRLWLQICDDCHSAVFMPRVLCPSCGSLSLAWVPSNGTGTVYSRAVIQRRAKPGEPQPQGHALVLVDLDEGSPDVEPDARDTPRRRPDRDARARPDRWRGRCKDRGL